MWFVVILADDIGSHRKAAGEDGSLGASQRRQEGLRKRRIEIMCGERAATNQRLDLPAATPEFDGLTLGYATAHCRQQDQRKPSQHARSFAAKLAAESASLHCLPAGKRTHPGSSEA